MRWAGVWRHSVVLEATPAVPSNSSDKCNMFLIAARKRGDAHANLQLNPPDLVLAGDGQDLDGPQRLGLTECIVHVSGAQDGL